MQTALRATTRVLAGGKIEVIYPQLPLHELVEVIVLFPMSKDSFPNNVMRSAMDILKDAPGHRLFGTAEDADKYMTEERDAWDH